MVDVPSQHDVDVKGSVFRFSCEFNPVAEVADVHEFMGEDRPACQQQGAQRPQETEPALPHRWGGGHTHTKKRTQTDSR